MKKKTLSLRQQRCGALLSISSSASPSITMKVKVVCVSYPEFRLIDHILSCSLSRIHCHVTVNYVRANCWIKISCSMRKNSPAQSRRKKTESTTWTCLNDVNKLMAEWMQRSSLREDNRHSLVLIKIGIERKPYTLDFSMLNFSPRAPSPTRASAFMRKVSWSPASMNHNEHPPIRSGKIIFASHKSIKYWKN